MRLLHCRGALFRVLNQGSELRVRVQRLKVGIFVHLQRDVWG